MKRQNEANKFCDGKPNGQLIVASKLNETQMAQYTENQLVF